MELGVLIQAFEEDPKSCIAKVPKEYFVLLNIYLPHNTNKMILNTPNKYNKQKTFITFNMYKEYIP